MYAFSSEGLRAIHGAVVSGQPAGHSEWNLMFSLWVFNLSCSNAVIIWRRIDSQATPAAILSATWARPLSIDCKTPAPILLVQEAFGSGKGGFTLPAQWQWFWPLPPGLFLRTTPKAKGETAPAVSAPRPVPVATVTREEVYNEVTFAAEFRPYNEVELHAKISGYVTNLSVDFGDQVKTGQLLAELEVPELKDQLDSAEAARQKAEADHTVAHWAYTRLMDVIKQHPNLVAQQELDAAQAKDLSTDAAIAAAKADMERYQTMIGVHTD